MDGSMEKDYSSATFFDHIRRRCGKISSFFSVDSLTSKATLNASIRSEIASLQSFLATHEEIPSKYVEYIALPLIIVVRDGEKWLDVTRESSFDCIRELLIRIDSITRTSCSRLFSHLGEILLELSSESSQDKRKSGSDEEIKQKCVECVAALLHVSIRNIVDRKRIITDFLDSRGILTLEEAQVTRPSELLWTLDSLVEVLPEFMDPKRVQEMDQNGMRSMRMGCVFALCELCEKEGSNVIKEWCLYALCGVIEMAIFENQMDEVRSYTPRVTSIAAKMIKASNTRSARIGSRVVSQAFHVLSRVFSFIFNDFHFDRIFAHHSQKRLRFDLSSSHVPELAKEDQAEEKWLYDTLSHVQFVFQDVFETPFSYQNHPWRVQFARLRFAGALLHHCRKALESHVDGFLECVLMESRLSSCVRLIQDSGSEDGRDADQVSSLNNPLSVIGSMILNELESSHPRHLIDWMQRRTRIHIRNVHRCVSMGGGSSSDLEYELSVLERIVEIGVYLKPSEDDSSTPFEGLETILLRMLVYLMQVDESAMVSVMQDRTDATEPSISIIDPAMPTIMPIVQHTAHGELFWEDVVKYYEALFSRFPSIPFIAFSGVRSRTTALCFSICRKLGMMVDSISAIMMDALLVEISQWASTDIHMAAESHGMIDDSSESLDVSRISNRSRLIAITRIFCEMLRGKWEICRGRTPNAVQEMKIVLNVLLEDKLWRDDVFMMSKVGFSSKKGDDGELGSIPTWMVEDHTKNPQDELIRSYYSTLLRATLLQTLSLVGVYCGNHFPGLIESMILFRIVSSVGDPHRIVHKSSQWALFILSNVKCLQTSLELVASNATILIDAIARRLRLLEEYPHTTNLLNALIICAIDSFEMLGVRHAEVDGTKSKQESSEPLKSLESSDDGVSSSTTAFVSLVEDTMDSVFEGLDRMIEITHRSHLSAMLSVVSNFCRLLGVKSEAEFDPPSAGMEVESESHWEASKPVNPHDLRMKKETQLLIDSLKRCSHFLGNRNDTIRSIGLDIVRHASWSLRRDHKALFPILHEVWGVLVHRLDKKEKHYIKRKTMDLAEFLVEHFPEFMQVRFFKSFWPRVSSLLHEWYEHEMHKKYVKKEELVMITSFEDVSMNDPAIPITSVKTKTKRERPLELEVEDWSASASHLQSQGEMVLDRTVVFVDRVVSMHPEWWKNGPLLQRTAEDVVGLVGVHPLVDAILQKLAFVDPDAIWYVLMTRVGRRQKASFLDQYVQERYPGWSVWVSKDSGHQSWDANAHPLQTNAHMLHWMDENGL
eukprot:TRINITY_DN1344_c3_g1_i1.p1 TRINITY_DN1344_c3_g1~~TRINITY_DN1344_c3_g1_i1.p1  ORF type:complete len:1284 (+),score=336.91 TRINITY_DN1344_c3_g1_i1:45-3896(+)